MTNYYEMKFLKFKKLQHLYIHTYANLHKRNITNNLNPFPPILTIHLRYFIPQIGPSI